jgi:predicted RNase H-like HicB family nuclease
MKKGLLKRVEELMEAPYTIEYNRDLTSGGKKVFLLSIIELPGCMAQGATIEEAQYNLRDAEKEYLLSLLEDGVPIPEPIYKRSNSSSGQVVFFATTIGSAGKGFVETLTGIVQPQQREKLGAISLVACGTD